MGDDQNLLSQIKKLHLLPGTVYVIGAALFATGLYTLRGDHKLASRLPARRAKRPRTYSALGADCSQFAAVCPRVVARLKYGLPCSACHIGWPILNNFGLAFKDNGYQLGNEKDSPIYQNPYWPMTFRITPQWHLERQSRVAIDATASNPGGEQTHHHAWL